MIKVLAVCVVVLFAAVFAKSLRQPGCFSYCFRETEAAGNFSVLLPCYTKCYQRVAKDLISDDTEYMLQVIPEAKPILSEIGIIQANVSVLSDNENFWTESDVESVIANPRPNATLEATTGLNIRGQACTGGKLITTVPAYTRMTFTNKVLTNCSFTWYSVQGTFGAGWAASNYLREVTPGRHYPLFKQCDAKWANDRLGGSTICRIGCLMSSVSMALNGLSRAIDGQASNPGVLNKYLSTHGGYSGDLFIWGSVAKFGFGYVGQTRDKAQIRNYVNQGKVVILNVRNGGHWVLATGVSGTSFTVNDPGFNVGVYTEAQVVLAGVYNV